MHDAVAAILAGIDFDALDLLCHAILLTTDWPSRGSLPPTPDSACPCEPSAWRGPLRSPRGPRRALDTCDCPVAQTRAGQLVPIRVKNSGRQLVPASLSIECLYADSKYVPNCLRLARG